MIRIREKGGSVITEERLLEAIRTGLKKELTVVIACPSGYRRPNFIVALAAGISLPPPHTHTPPHCVVKACLLSILNGSTIPSLPIPPSPCHWTSTSFHWGPLCCTPTSSSANWFPPSSSYPSLSSPPPTARLLRVVCSIASVSSAAQIQSLISGVMSSPRQEGIFVRTLMKRSQSIDPASFHSRDRTISPSLSRTMSSWTLPRMRKGN
jgi:hypothetical protein